MIPAEIFPTCYRCTCHGIAAAAGKLGSLIVLIILHFIRSNDPDSKQLWFIFVIFGFVMAVGAIFAFAWTPDVQNRHESGGEAKLPCKTLEELGEGLGHESLELASTIGFRKRWKSLMHQRAPSDE
jgi:PHS family inorganic phosphate transporter-like MFS transporter